MTKIWCECCEAVIYEVPKEKLGRLLPEDFVSVNGSPPIEDLLTATCPCCGRTLLRDDQIMSLARGDNVSGWETGWDD